VGLEATVDPVDHDDARRHDAPASDRAPAGDRPGGARPDGPPDTVAVALHYDSGAAPPTVVASGRGYVAEQILALAFENGVKVRQDADLAQMLAALDVDSEIPAEAFAAVAEILAYVYRANGQMPGGTPVDGGAPDQQGAGDEERLT